LAMGKPVVSTPLPAVVDYAEASGLARVAGDAERFLRLLDEAVRSDPSIGGPSGVGAQRHVGRMHRERLQRDHGVFAQS
jgi:hypothetical protein